MADEEDPDDDDETSEEDDAPAISLEDKGRRARLEKLLSIRRKLTDHEVAALRVAFPLIFRAHLPGLWGRLRRRGLIRADAEDRVTTTFATAFREICDGGFQENLSAQLNRILRDNLLNFLRGKKRSPLSLGLPSSGSEPPGSDPELARNRALDRADLEERLRSVLSDKLWEVVDLVFLNDVEPIEAAAILGIPEGTVHSRLKRAKERLARLAHLWVPPSKRK